MGWAGKFGGQKTHDPPPPFGMKLSEPILNEGRKSHDRLPITLDIFGYIIQQNRILCMNCGIIYVLRQKRYRLPFRKRAVNLRKTRHGVHVSENPLFSNCFAKWEFEYSYEIIPLSGSFPLRWTPDPFSGIDRSVSTWRMSCLPVFTDIFWVCSSGVKNWKSAFSLVFQNGKIYYLAIIQNHLGYYCFPVLSQLKVMSLRNVWKLDLKVAPQGNHLCRCAQVLCFECCFYVPVYTQSSQTYQM